MELMKVQHCEAPFLEMQEYEAYFTCMSPSQQTIAGCYLADFWEKEKFFTHCMAAISVDDDDAWLSCDHTFAAAGKSWQSSKYVVREMYTHFCVSEPEKLLQQLH